MRKTAYILLIFLFLMNAGVLFANQGIEATSGVLQATTALDVLFNKVLVQKKDGELLSGLLVGVQNDSLVLRREAADMKISFRDMTKIIIENEKNSSSSSVFGMLMGVYIGNLVLYRDNDQPLAYVDAHALDLGMILVDVLYAGIGGGFFNLLQKVFKKKEESFDLSGSLEAANAEWERLQRYVVGDRTSSKRFHLNVQASHVFPQATDQYRDMLSQQNHVFHGYEVAHFNLLRKIQLTYSIRPGIDVGMAYFGLGEPSIRASGYQYENGNSNIELSLDSVGYYVVGMYDPFSKSRKQKISWKLGLGAGVADINFKLKSRFDYRTYLVNDAITEYNISKNRLSGVIFTELNLYLQNTFSIGLAADYVYIPDEMVPAIQEPGLPPLNLRFRTGSVGFTLGFHF